MAASVFESFPRIRVDGQMRFEIATCGRRFFYIRGKKISLFDNIRIRETGTKHLVLFSKNKVSACVTLG